MQVFFIFIYLFILFILLLEQLICTDFLCRNCVHTEVIANIAIFLAQVHIYMRVTQTYRNGVSVQGYGSTIIFYII